MLATLDGWLRALPALVLVTGLWLLLASPLLLGLHVLVRRLRRRAAPPALPKLVLLSAAFSLLAAPVPTPIITIFYPHVLMLFGGYADLLHGPPLYRTLLAWVPWSLGLTFSTALAWSWWRTRPRPRA